MSAQAEEACIGKDDEYDVLLVGAGLANGLIAWRLRQCRPELTVGVVESDTRPGGNHTWSFHQHDVSADQHAWLAPLVAHRWSGYDVRFPDFSRTLPGDYISVTAERFAGVLEAALGERLMTATPVAALTPTQVTLEDGRTLRARAVIDGRGYRPSPHLIVGAQAFLGQQWRLAAPHGLTRPRLMDASVAQGAGYRFVYTLPLSADTLLIEDTHYIDADALDVPTARANIAHYANDQGWTLKTLEREEQGTLPITLTGDISAFWKAHGNQPVSGLRAGLFHATTGYSLPQAVALADAIAKSSSFDAATLTTLIQRQAKAHWQTQRFFRLLNRMLFLAGPAEQRWRVMQRFYTLNDGLIARFYAGQLTLADKARLLSGKPPVPLGEAMQAVLKRTPRLRAFHHE